MTSIKPTLLALVLIMCQLMNLITRVTGVRAKYPVGFLVFLGAHCGVLAWIVYDMTPHAARLGTTATLVSEAITVVYAATVVTGIKSLLALKFRVVDPIRVGPITYRSATSRPCECRWHRIARVDCQSCAGTGLRTD